MDAPLPANETERLAALARYGARDPEVASALADLSRLAARCCATPVAMVTLVDEDSLRVSAAIGTTQGTMPRAASCCARTILQPDVYVVPDLGEDERFASHPMLGADPPMRFYAGVPLVTADGFALGALCVYDREPRDLDAAGREALRVLARQVMTTLELRRLQISRRLRTEQVIRHQAALRDLARRDLSDWTTALETITEIAAETLDVARVGIWLFEDGNRELRAVDVFQLSDRTHKSGERLHAHQLPRYFQALEEARTIAAHDVQHDPRTAELVSDYLAPHGITSLMDDPVRLHGRLVGILCHEHIGPPRRWTIEEQDFSAAIADRVALALEARHRREAEARGQGET